MRRAESSASSTGNAPLTQRSEQLGLAPEARQAVRVGREHLGKHLDRHVAIQVGVRRPPDDTHAALADLFDQAVVE
jgi:hypothetical protein